MSKESIENIAKSKSIFAPTFVNHYVLPDVMDPVNTSINKKLINIFVSYILNQWARDLNTDIILSSCLFGSLKLTKNADPDRYIYSGYGIGFNSRSEFSLPDGSVGKIVIIFRADMSSSVHVDNKNKDILILGNGTTQGLDDTTLTAKVK